MKRLPLPHKVTLRHVAAQAGCSQNTVSLALRASPRISVATRLRIAELAAKLQYTPDFNARRLRVQRSGVIGVFTRALDDAVRTAMVNHLLAELHTVEYRPVLGLADSPTRPWFESPWMTTFRELRLEALVILWGEMREFPAWTRGLPIILVGNHPHPELPCDYLALDRAEAGALGVEHLVTRGHRRILVGGIPGSEFETGCLKALQRHGLRPAAPLLKIPTVEPAAAREAGRAWGARRNRPTAALFNDSTYAAWFMRGLTDAGCHVPGDLALVGYDYLPWADLLPVPLTTIEQPIRAMAGAALDLVRRRLTMPDAPLQHLVLPHRLVLRASS